MKKTVLTVVGIIGLAAGIYMLTQKNNPRLTEFRNTWWIALMIGFICIAASGIGEKK